MADQSNTVQLSQPLKTIFRQGDTERAETITEVTVRVDVRAKDLRCMDGVNGEVAKTIALIAHLTGLMVKQVDDLPVADFAKLAEIVGEFVPNGQETGETG